MSLFRSITIFSGDNPSPEDKVKQRRPLIAYGDLAVYGDIHESLVRLAINQRTPVTRDGRSQDQA